MKKVPKYKGSVLLIAVFVIALLSTLVIGMLQINTEEIQIAQYQVNAAKAMLITEAGLNDAFAELRDNSGWTAGFTNKAFSDGSYTVAVTGSLPNLTVNSTGIWNNSLGATIEADVTLSDSSPYIIRVDALRVNE